MKYIIILSALIINVLSVQGQTSNNISAPAVPTYVNNYFKFSATIHKEWKQFGTRMDTTSSKPWMIVQWSLPLIYCMNNIQSKTTISIKAYKNVSADSLITLEYLDKAGMCALEYKGDDNMRIIYCTKDGLEYWGKCYFTEKNGIGYVVTVMGSPVTYEAELPAFEKFYKSIQFL